MQVPSTENICFTTTAMPRPELLEITYKSFRDHIKWLDFSKITLFLHIDRFPVNIDEQAPQKIERVIEIANQYFGKVIVKHGDYPNFANAVKWIFTSADKDFIFNLEDDWELLCDIPQSICNFFADSKVQQVGLRATKKSNARFVLSPCILRSSFASKAAQQVIRQKNPEERIRAWNPHRPEEAFIYYPLEHEYVVLKDLGRSWMKSTAFARGMDDWTSWKFLPNSITRARNQVIEDQNVQINYDIIKNPLPE